MDPDAVSAQVLPTFLEELAHHVATLRDGAAVFAEPARARGEDGESVVRAAHTVKGGASALGFGLVADAGRMLEAVLTEVRGGHSLDGPDLALLLPRAADALEDAGARLDRGESLSESPLDALVSEMASTVGEPRAVPVPAMAPEADAYEPTAGGAVRRSGLGVLVFRVAGERYGLEFDEVVRVVAMVAVAPLPGGPDIALGVINYQGRVVPVLDLRCRLGLTPLRYGPDARLVVARAGSRVVALPVDDIVDVVEIAEGQVSVPGAVFPGIGPVSGLVALPDGLLLIADLEAFLSVDEAHRLDEALEVDA